MLAKNRKRVTLGGLGKYGKNVAELSHAKTIGLQNIFRIIFTVFSAAIRAVRACVRAALAAACLFEPGTDATGGAVAATAAAGQSAAD